MKSPNTSWIQTKKIITQILPGNISDGLWLLSTMIYQVNLIFIVDSSENHPSLNKKVSKEKIVSF